MGFELYEAKGKRHRDPPAGPPVFVTVTDSNNLLVNRWASEGLGHPVRVLLYFDRGTRTVGMRPAPEDDSRASRASRRGDGRQFTVGCMGFVREHEIANGRFPAAMEDGMLVFEVGEPGGRFLKG